MKGGPIVATDHTVIIGWSPLGFNSHGLAIANENQGKCSVAILCPGSKVKLEESVADLPMKTTKIVVRKGKSTSLSDFDQVRLNAARNVIVLGSGTPRNTTARSFATLLALAPVSRRTPNSMQKSLVVSRMKPTERQRSLPQSIRSPSSTFGFCWRG